MTPAVELIGSSAARESRSTWRSLPHFFRWKSKHCVVTWSKEEGLSSNCFEENKHSLILALKVKCVQFSVLKTFLHENKTNVNSLQIGRGWANGKTSVWLHKWWFEWENDAYHYTWSRQVNQICASLFPAVVLGTKTRDSQIFLTCLFIWQRDIIYKVTMNLHFCGFLWNSLNVNCT